MFFVFVYLERIGKKHRKIIWFYLVELVLIHVCIVFIQIYHNGFEAPKLAYEALKYVFYFNVIGCFSWLYMLNDDVWRTLKYYKKTPDMAFDDLMQTTLTEEEKNRIWKYYLFGFGIPVILTTVAVALNQSEDDIKFSWSEPIKNYFNSTFALVFVLLPVAVLFIYGLIRFGQTLFYVRRMIAKESDAIIHEINILERKK